MLFSDLSSRSSFLFQYFRTKCSNRISPQWLLDKRFNTLCYINWLQVSSFYCHCQSEKSKNPKTAVAEFLKTKSDFVVDQAIDEKLLVSAAQGGYLKRIK